MKNKLTEQQIEEIVWNTLCDACPYAHRCHDDIDPCDEYYEQIEKLSEENK